MNEAKLTKNEICCKQNYMAKCHNETNYLSQFLDNLPKQPSHYVRNSSKLYLEQFFNSSYPIFHRAFQEKNLSLVSPKKDRCDLCIEYEEGNLYQTVAETYRKQNKIKRRERMIKRKPVSNNALHCGWIYKQSVSPRLNASKIYFRATFSCYNFTI